MKKERLTEVITIYPKVNMNVCNKFNGNPSNRLLRHFNQSQKDDVVKVSEIH